MGGFTIFGGKLFPAVGQINILGDLPVPLEKITEQIEDNEARGLPSYRNYKGRTQRLAIVGGGPSIERSVDFLRRFSDVWAINGAWKWCADHGIDATFLSIDPHPIVSQWAGGAKRAILASQCPHVAFESLAMAGAEVTCFTLGDGLDETIPSGSSTATAAPILGARMGYRDFNFFGCESSYPAGRTHAYQHEEREVQFIVETEGGEHYLTAPDFYKQACELACFIRVAPHRARAYGGGLLRALVKQPAHNIAWFSDAMAEMVLENVRLKEEARRAAEAAEAEEDSSLDYDNLHDPEDREDEAA